MPCWMTVMTFLTTAVTGATTFSLTKVVTVLAAPLIQLKKPAANALVVTSAAPPLPNSCTQPATPTFDTATSPLKQPPGILATHTLPLPNTSNRLDEFWYQPVRLPLALNRPPATLTAALTPKSMSPLERYLMLPRPTSLPAIESLPSALISHGLELMYSRLPSMLAKFPGPMRIPTAPLILNGGGLTHTPNPNLSRKTFVAIGTALPRLLTCAPA